MDRANELSPEERDRTIAILREHLLDVNNLETASGPLGSDPRTAETLGPDRDRGDVPLMESEVPTLSSNFGTHDIVPGQSRIL